MKSNAPLLDDLLTLGGSLFGNLLEARHDIKAQARMGVDSLARKLDLVSREEFDAAFAMLAKARLMQDDLAERLERIEAHLHLSKHRGHNAFKGIVSPPPDLDLSRAAKNKSAKKSPLPSLKQGKNRARKK